MSDTPRRAPTLTAVIATMMSAAAHLGLVAIGASSLPGLLAPRGAVSRWQAITPQAAWRVQTIDIELPGVLSGSVAQPGPPTPAELLVAAPTGGQGIARPDSGRRGRGGTDTASQPGVNLADRDDGLRLARELTSHLDRDQVSRVRSAQKRRSFDDERLTTNPMELTFLASGQGQEQERRPEADTSPSNGFAHAAAASAVGGDRIGGGAMPEGVGLPPTPSGTPRLGTERASPGAGMVERASGDDHRDSAASAFARPLVDRGDPSVPSDQAGSPQDTVDSRQEVAAKLQSPIDSSTAGGRPGEGPGGAKGAGPTGAGGLQGPGSRSHPMGYGPGAYGASGVDPRVTEYRRRVVAKLWPYWEHAFPHWAIAELRQGTVFVSVEIVADGRVRNVRVTRPSGIDEFDRNCVAAVLRASPFEPIPPNLGVRSIRWELSFDASNPAVR